MTEPRGGSDAAGLALRARKDGDDYILDGEKTSISLSTQADGVLLFARTGTDEERSRGISAFYAPLNEPGVTRTSFDDMGSGAVGRGSLFFDDVRIPGDYLLGAEGAGFRQVMSGFDFSRGLIGLMVLGPARQSMEEAWQYTTEREAFGNPIASYQGVTQPLAECATYLRRVVAKIPTQNGRCAGLHRHQSRKDSKQRRLPTSIGTDKGKDFAFPYFKLEPVHRAAASIMVG